MKVGKPSRRSLELSKFDRFKDSKKIILNSISSKSRDTFSNIISRISNACYNMVNRFNGDEATMSNMRNIAMGQTRRLSMEFKKINYKNEQMNLHYLETYSDNPDLISPIRNQEKEHHFYLLGKEYNIQGVKYNKKQFKKQLLTFKQFKKEYIEEKSEL